MSKFWAKVRLEDGKNAEQLIRAFFQDFNPASSIVVRGKEAKMEIVFRQSPMAIIDAISHCEVIELNCGKNLKEYEEDETAESESSDQAEQAIAESKSPDQAEPAITESESSDQAEPAITESESSDQTEPVKKRQVKYRKADTTKVVKSEEPINLPKLEEIAKKATSFKHFAKLVAEWLEMGKKQELFENFITASTEVDKMSWKKLEEVLKNRGITYIQWDRISCSQQVSKMLKEDSVTILQFLNSIRQYKDYPFKKVEENSTEQATEEAMQSSEEVVEESNESIIPKQRVKMECMPEIKEFEETLASVDKTQPIEERVRYVFEAMGLKKLSVDDQKQIVEFASAIVNKGNTSNASIMEENTIVRMKLSKFVCDFVQKYESGKKVKLLTFLSELQKIIMLDSEAKN